MLAEAQLPDAVLEEARCRLHHNDVHYPRYREFTSPITRAILRDFPVGASGIDYGCGPGPVAAFVLREAGYPVALYDPYFENHLQALDQTYDYIICCEVMEHFHFPATQFETTV